jgi:hypothetical protein
MLPPSQHERGTSRGCRVVFDYIVTPPTRWTGSCGAPTIAPYCPRQQPVRTCQSPCLGMTACLWFQGLPLLALYSCTVPRPKGPVYQLRGHWPFVYVMPQDTTVYRHAGRSSLMSWGTFQAAWAVPGRSILATAVLTSFAHKSRELVHDVSHHG